MKNLKLSGILLLCLLVAACGKRKYPEENVQLEKEDIYVTGSVDGEPVNLKIGTDGYYCYSSYKQRTDSVYLFTGELRKFDCNPCVNALQVELSDTRTRMPGSSVEVESSFRTGARIFIPGLEKMKSIKLVASSNKEISAVHWNISTGASSESAEMNCEFGQPGVQTVSLTVRTKNNCESRIVNKIYVDADGYFASSVNATLVQDMTSTFLANVQGGKLPYRYEWSFGDGAVSSEQSPGHTYQWTGSYPVTVKIWDADNRFCETNYIHIAGNDQSSCSANMTLSDLGTKNVFLNGAKIQWKDQANRVLRSDSVAQPTGSYFEIVSSEPYAENERGEPGRLLTLRFNVLLSGGGRKVWFKSDNAAIAVTYK